MLFKPKFAFAAVQRPQQGYISRLGQLVATWSHGGLAEAGHFILSFLVTPTHLHTDQASKYEQRKCDQPY